MGAGKGEVWASSPLFSHWRPCSPGLRSSSLWEEQLKKPCQRHVSREATVCGVCKAATCLGPCRLPSPFRGPVPACRQGKAAGPHGSPWLAPGPGPLLGSCCAQGVFLESFEGPGNRTQDWQTKFQLGPVEPQSSKSAVSLKRGLFLHGAILGESRSCLSPAPWDLRGVSWGPKDRGPRTGPQGSLCV